MTLSGEELLNDVTRTEIGSQVNLSCISPPILGDIIRRDLLHGHETISVIGATCLLDNEFYLVRGLSHRSASGE